MPMTSHNHNKSNNTYVVDDDDVVAVVALVDISCTCAGSGSGSSRRQRHAFLHFLATMLTADHKSSRTLLHTAKQIRGFEKQLKKYIQSSIR